MEPVCELLEKLKKIYTENHGEIPKEVKPFINKLQSLYFSPAAKSRKKADQILPYLNTAHAEEYIIHILNNYPIWQMDSCPVTTYSYFIVFLIHKRSKEGIDLIHFIADKLMENKSIFLNLIPVQFFPEREDLKMLISKINAYSIELTAESDASKWVRRIDIEVPEEWHITFDLSNAVKEKNRWDFDKYDFNLNIRIYGPARGNGCSWTITLDNGEEKYLNWWNETDSSYKLTVHGKELPLSTLPSLLDFTYFLKNLEEIISVKFDREPRLVSMSKGIKKKKNLEEYFLTL